MHLYLDLETYSSEDLSKVGVSKYAAAEDFNILLCAYTFDDEDIQVLDLSNTDDKETFSLLYKFITDQKYTKSAYNASFEIACLARYFKMSEQEYETMLGSFTCSMAQAAYCRLPIGLSATGKALGLPESAQKSTVGKRLIELFCKPTKKSLAGRVTPQQEPEKWDLFKAYCKQDVEAERAIHQALAAHPLPEDELALWRHTVRMNARGIAIDCGLVDGAITIMGDEEARLAREAASLGVSNPNSLPQLKAAVNAALDGVETITSLNAAMVDELLEKYPENVILVALLENRQAGGKSSLAKYPAMRDSAFNGRVHDLTMYYGASRTGRFSGRNVQIQNLPRNSLTNIDLARGIAAKGETEKLRVLFGDVNGTLKELIRTAFIPAPGHTFLIADFSAIEARVIAWLAGEAWVNKVFAGDGRIYEMTAAAMFGVPIDKIRPGLPEYALRQKGKVATLACIAKGELVLTDLGLIPIEKVTTNQRVWDGMHWVTHEGVIYKGVKEIIEYDGLTATPDHLVWIEGQLQPVQFRYAAACGAHLIQTGAGRRTIWVGDNHQSGKALGPQVDTLPCTNPMRRLRPRTMVRSVGAIQWKIQRLSGVLTAKANTVLVGPQAYSGETALRKSQQSTIYKLWRQGDHIQFLFNNGGGSLDSCECARRETRIRNGSHRHKRKLRLRKYSFCSKYGQSWKSEHDRFIRMGPPILALRPISGNTSAVCWNDANRCNPISGARSQRKTEKLALNRRTSPVYDIRNAGPNHCFTVSDKLVHNCGYGGGAGALINMGALRMGLTEAELPDIVKRWRTANPYIVQLWADTEEAALETAQTCQPTRVRGLLTFTMKPVNGAPALLIRLPNGRELYYLGPVIKNGGKFDSPSLHYLDAMAGGKQQLTPTFGGKLVENVVQAIARDCLCLTLTRLEDAGYRVVFHVHDEVIIEAPEGADLQPVLDIMAQPIPWAPGLVLRGAGFTSQYYMKD